MPSLQVALFQYELNETAVCRETSVKHKHLPPTLQTCTQVLPLLQVGSMLMFENSSDLCMTGNDVKFDPDVVPAPSIEYLSETQ